MYQRASVCNGGWCDTESVPQCIAESTSVMWGTDCASVYHWVCTDSDVTVDDVSLSLCLNVSLSLCLIVLLSLCLSVSLSLSPHITEVRTQNTSSTVTSLSVSLSLSPQCITSVMWGTDYITQCITESVPQRMTEDSDSVTHDVIDVY